MTTKFSHLLSFSWAAARLSFLAYTRTSEYGIPDVVWTTGGLTFFSPCSAEEEQTCWCWVWEIVKQTAVGMGSQGSLIQVEHFQFLGCMMGAARTLEPWHGCLGVHLELIQGGPDYQTSRRWAILSNSNPWLDAKCYSCHCHQELCSWFSESNNLIIRHDEAMIMEKPDQLWTSVSVL